jgi:hypothetical protein
MKSRFILMNLDFISLKQRNDKITSVIYIRKTKIMRNKRLIATIVFCFYSFINVIGQDSINIWKDVDKGLMVKCQAENRSKVLKDITLHKKIKEMTKKMRKMWFKTHKKEWEKERETTI